MILRIAAPLILVLAVAGCKSTGDIEVAGGVGVGVTAVRTVCPMVALPAGTGDLTLFDPPASRDAAAIDVTATMTNVRSICDDSGAEVVTTVSFDVRARRTRIDAPRDVTLPYFITVVRGGTAVTAKRIGRVGVHFDAGQAVASTAGQATANVSRAAATLPADVREKLTRRRKAGDQDAALDPLAQPEVRQAVLSATFEALVGFQLTEEQLRYNATR